jgi:HSP20 family molecular chaperone IbpA
MNELLRQFGPVVFPTIANETIQRLMNDVEQSFKQPIKQVFPYPIDIIKYYSNEAKKIVKLRFDVALAGISKDDIKVQLKKGKILSISIERGNPDEIDDGLDEIYVSKSISYRDGEISFKLYSDVDLERFKPIFKDGLLTIDVYFKEIVKDEEVIDIEIQ